MVLFDVSCIFKGVFLHHLNLEISCDWHMLGGWQLVPWVLNEIHLFLDWLNVLSTVDTTSFENIMLKQLLYSMWMLIDRLSLLSHLAMTNYWPSTLDEGSLQSLLVVASYCNRIFEPATDHHYLSQCQPWIDEANAVVYFRWKGIDCTTKNGSFRGCDCPLKRIRLHIFFGWFESADQKLYLYTRNSDKDTHAIWHFSMYSTLYVLSSDFICIICSHIYIARFYLIFSMAISGT